MMNFKKGQRVIAIFAGRAWEEGRVMDVLHSGCTVRVVNKKGTTVKTFDAFNQTDIKDYYGRR